MPNILENAFLEALQSSSPVSPDLLLNELKKAEDPMAFFQDDRGAYPDLCKASQVSLQHIDICRAQVSQEMDIPIELSTQLVGTICWLLNQIKNFEKSHENARATLAGVFETCARLSQISTFWQFVPQDRISRDFSELIKGILGKNEFSISDEGAPVWERELIQSIEDADHKEHWSDLSDHWSEFEHIVQPHYLHSEAARFWYAQDPRVLVEVIDGQTSMWEVLHVTKCLTAEQQLHLASLAQSNRTRFVLTKEAIFHLPKNESLNEKQTEYLEDALSKVISDVHEWKKWMGAFNKYPVRVPQLQAALGKILSSGDNSAFRAYVESISLYHGHNDCRVLVKDCLTVFRDNASPERRKELWKIAYDQWDRWNFGISTGDVVLTQVAWSQLDFAVIGYFVEVLDYAELEERRSTFPKVVLDLQFEWFAASVDLFHNFNHEISRFALFLDPSNCKLDWSLPPQYCLPYNPKQDRYAELTFNP